MQMIFSKYIKHIDNNHKTFHSKSYQNLNSKNMIYTIEYKTMWHDFVRICSSMKVAIILLVAMILFLTIESTIGAHLSNKFAPFFTTVTASVFIMLTILLFLNIFICTFGHVFKLVSTLLITKKISYKLLRSFGVQLIHISILLIILGCIITKYTAESRSIILEEGNIFEIETTGTQIKLNQFNIFKYPDGSIKSYQSQLSVLRMDQKVVTPTIQVNDPLGLDGYTFYQSGYGKMIELLIQAPGKDPIELHVRKSNKTTPKAGAIIGNMTVLFSTERYYSELTMARDPGAMLIWAAFGMMGIGMIIILTIPKTRKETL